MATWTSTGARSRRAVMANTGESAPTDPADGVDLTDVLAIVPVVQAPGGQTFTGTGTMLGYVYPAGGTIWVRAPATDMDMTDLANLSAAALPALPVNSPVGRFMLVPSAVGLSSGATVTTDFVCVTRRGEAA